MTRAPHDLRLLRLKRAPCRVILRFPSQALLDEAAVLTAMAYVDLNPIRAGIAETPETSDFTSVQQRIAAWKGRQTTTTNDEIRPEKNENASLDATIIKLLEFSDDSKGTAENTIPYSTTDYLELVDWSGRVIVEGKTGFIPKQLPPILQRSIRSIHHPCVARRCQVP